MHARVLATALLLVVATPVIPRPADFGLTSVVWAQAQRDVRVQGDGHRERVGPGEYQGEACVELQDDKQKQHHKKAQDEKQRAKVNEIKTRLKNFGYRDEEISEKKTADGIEVEANLKNEKGEVTFTESYVVDNSGHVVRGGYVDHSEGSGEIWKLTYDCEGRVVGGVKYEWYTFKGKLQVVKFELRNGKWVEVGRRP